jgi:hypothetical protein
VVSVRGELETADVSIPRTDATATDSAPACLGDDAFARAIQRVAAAVVGKELSEPETGGDGLFGSVGGLVGR